MEDYPSLAEGNGLENRQVGQTTQEFESLILLFIIAGWSSLVARRAHNPKVVGSNPAPATNNPIYLLFPINFNSLRDLLLGSFFISKVQYPLPAFIHHCILLFLIQYS